MEKTAKRKLNMTDEISVNESSVQLSTPGNLTESPSPSTSAQKQESTPRKFTSPQKEYKIQSSVQLSIPGKLTESPGASTSTQKQKSTPGNLTESLSSSTSAQKQESTPGKFTSAQKQNKIQSLTQTVQSTMSDMELYTTSAMYYFSNGNSAAGTEKLEKGRRKVKSHSQKCLALLKNLESDLSAQDQKTNSLMHRESFLLNKIGQMQQEMEGMKKKMNKMQKENESFFSDDAFDNSDHAADSLYSDDFCDKLETVPESPCAGNQ